MLVSNVPSGIPRRPNIELNEPRMCTQRQRDEEQISNRKVPTPLARLKTGHSRHSIAYAHLMNGNIDPNCPKCHEKLKTVERWLNCQSTAACRQEIFGTTEPCLELLSGKPALSIALAKRTLLGANYVHRPTHTHTQQQNAASHLLLQNLLYF